MTYDPGTPYILTPHLHAWLSFINASIRQLLRAQYSEFSNPRDNAAHPTSNPDEEFFNRASDLLRSSNPESPLNQGQGNKPGEFSYHPELIKVIYTSILNYVVEEAAKNNKSVKQFLLDQFPVLQELGKLYIHIAESPPEAPPESSGEFYFGSASPLLVFATYTTNVNSAGKVLHMNIGQAIQYFYDNKASKSLKSLIGKIKDITSILPRLSFLQDQNKNTSPAGITFGLAHDLIDHAPSLEGKGIRIKIPSHWKSSRPPRLSAQLQIEDSAKTTMNSHAILNPKIEFYLDGKLMSFQEAEPMLACEQDAINVNGNWIEIDRRNIETVKTQFSQVQQLISGEPISLRRAFQIAARLNFNGFPNQMDLNQSPNQPEDHTTSSEHMGRRTFIDISALSKRLTGIQSKLHPDIDCVTQAGFPLLPHQKQGTSWLMHLHGLGLGGILADDMGLGKTLQTIAFIYWLQNISHNKEKDGTPKVINSLIICPPSLTFNWLKEFQKFSPSQEVQVIGNNHRGDLLVGKNAMQRSRCLIVSYTNLNRNPWLFNLKFDFLAFDEAQYIKNSFTQVFQLVQKVPAAMRLALSGTPVENSLSDIWSLFEFCNPGILGNLEIFLKKTAKTKSQEFLKLRSFTKPFVLRRLKSDASLSLSLPDKKIISISCPMSNEQKQDYARVVARYKRSSDTPDQQQSILALITRLKQIGIHPNFAKHKAIRDTDSSGKLQKLFTILVRIKQQKEKIVVFSQFSSIFDDLSELITKSLGMRCWQFSGKTPRKERENIVTSFNASSEANVLLISMKAGGSGLNLYTAKYLVLLDGWWNPAVHSQAIDRIYRIGQQRDVTIYKLVTESTIERQIEKLLKTKQDRADSWLLAEQGNLP